MTERTGSGIDDRDAMREDMREFHRVYMLTLWLFLGVPAAIGFVIWALLYFSGRLAE